MHQGVARNGAHLFPAFPYDHFTKLRDEDVAALYAYMMTRPIRWSPPAKRNTVPFPLNIRALQAGWKLLFFRMGRFEPDKDQERRLESRRLSGREAQPLRRMPHAAQRLGAEKRDKAYAGAAVDNWIAPALTAANPTPVAWNVESSKPICAPASANITAPPPARWRRSYMMARAHSAGRRPRARRLFRRYQRGGEADQRHRCRARPRRRPA
jgi:hypothetical protein